MKISVVTAIYGDFDGIPPIPNGFDEAVLVSDRPIKSDWKNIVHPLPIPNRLAAKLPKFRPDLFSENNFSVWMDGSCRDPHDWLIRTAKTSLQQHDLWAFRHPERTCIYEEAKLCIDWKKYRDWPIDKQIEKYRILQFPKNYGLWACGVIMRRHTDQMKNFGSDWFLENSMYSIQDQISFPFLLWRSGIKCHPLPGKIWGDQLQFVPHRVHESDSLHVKTFRKIRRIFL